MLFRFAYLCTSHEIKPDARYRKCTKRENEKCFYKLQNLVTRKQKIETI